ncbi:hypothetical protein [Streptomyces sp. NPDC091649]|uniref:hypothetical protein n=1 Tax=Streptomyces sp. NPDC091649 TaxID=3366004 RepID=UPI003826E366
MTDAATQLLALVAATGVLTGAGLLLARRTRSEQPHPTTTSPAHQPQAKNLRKKSAATVVRDVRQLGALGVWCVCMVYTATRLDTPSEGMFLTALITAAVVLTLPEFFGLATRLLTEHDARRRLARRQLRADRRRAQAALAVLTVIIGAGLGMLALLDTLIRSSENTVQPESCPARYSWRTGPAAPSHHPSGCSPCSRRATFSKIFPRRNSTASRRSPWTKPAPSPAQPAKATTAAS